MPESYTRYCLGFLFTEDKSQVMLLEKQSPDWQKGKLNGVGGHIEEGEHADHAMVREFKEETGVATNKWDWLAFGAMDVEGWNCVCYVCFNTEYFKAVRQTEVHVPTPMKMDELWSAKYRMLRNIPLLVYAASMYPDYTLLSLYYDVPSELSGSERDGRE